MSYLVDQEHKLCRTAFDDGEELVAAPQYDDEYKARAVSLGYGEYPDPCWALCIEHDLVHTILARAEGFEYSPTLYAVAHDTTVPENVSHREECLVLCVQQLLNQVRKTGALLA